MTCVYTQMNTGVETSQQPVNSAEINGADRTSDESRCRMSTLQSGSGLSSEILPNPANLDLESMQLMYHFEHFTSDTLLFGAAVWRDQILSLALRVSDMSSLLSDPHPSIDTDLDAARVSDARCLDDIRFAPPVLAAFSIAAQPLCSAAYGPSTGWL